MDEDLAQKKPYRDLSVLEKRKSSFEKDNILSYCYEKKENKSH